jgi:hypothetical protein
MAATAAGEIAAGKTRGPAGDFRAGDYVAATITCQGKIDIEFHLPDGFLLRRFPVTSAMANANSNL